MLDDSESRVVLGWVDYHIGDQLQTPESERSNFQTCINWRRSKQKTLSKEDNSLTTYLFNPSLILEAGSDIWICGFGWTHSLGASSRSRKASPRPCWGQRYQTQPRSRPWSRSRAQCNTGTAFCVFVFLWIRISVSLYLCELVFLYFRNQGESCGLRTTHSIFFKLYHE